jgi:hypothetical protein
MPHPLDALFSLVDHFKSWVAIDCETTGLLPRGRLIELAAVHFDATGRTLQQFHALASPGFPLTKQIVRLTGLTDDDLKNKDPGSTVVSRFLHWLPADVPLIAHNADFDIQILCSASPIVSSQLAGRIVFDTVRVARELHMFPDCRLETVARILNHGLIPRLLHRARVDVEYVQQLFLYALNRNNQSVSHPEHPSDSEYAANS